MITQSDKPTNLGAQTDCATEAFGLFNFTVGLVVQVSYPEEENMICLSSSFAPGLALEDRPKTEEVRSSLAQSFEHAGGLLSKQ